MHCRWFERTRLLKALLRSCGPEQFEISLQAKSDNVTMTLRLNIRLILCFICGLIWFLIHASYSIFFFIAKTLYSLPSPGNDSRAEEGGNICIVEQHVFSQRANFLQI